MIYKLIAEKNHRCTHCKKTIKKGEGMITKRIGRLKPSRFHLACYKEYLKS